MPGHPPVLSIRLGLGLGPFLGLHARTPVCAPARQHGIPIRTTVEPLSPMADPNTWMLSFHMVDPTVNWPILGFFACETHMLQKRLESI